MRDGAVRGATTSCRYIFLPSGVIEGEAALGGHGTCAVTIPQRESVLGGRLDDQWNGCCVAFSASVPGASTTQLRVVADARRAPRRAGRVSAAACACGAVP